VDAPENCSHEYIPTTKELWDSLVSAGVCRASDRLAFAQMEVILEIFQEARRNIKLRGVVINRGVPKKDKDAKKKQVPGTEAENAAERDLRIGADGSLIDNGPTEKLELSPEEREMFERFKQGDALVGRPSPALEDAISDFIKKKIMEEDNVDADIAEAETAAMGPSGKAGRGERLNPAVKALLQANEALLRLETEFGLTPSSKRRTMQPIDASENKGETEEDRYEAFRNRKFRHDG